MDWTQTRSPAVTFGELYRYTKVEKFTCAGVFPHCDNVAFTQREDPLMVKYFNDHQKTTFLFLYIFGLFC